MRLARFDLDGRERVGLVDADGEAVRPLPEGTDLLALLAAPADERERAAAGAQAPVPLAGVRLLAPLRPATIRDFSVFEQHLEGAIKGLRPDAEMPTAWYEAPYCYFSNPHAITGPGDEIAVPPGCRELDLELEVAAIIGTAGRDLTVEQAREAIVGYTIFNDWSARDVGTKEIRLPFGQCKGKDFANTLGPWIVTPDQLEPHRDGDRYDLDMRAFINGVELGDDTLANMAWSFEELVVYAARGAWVRPGDVIGSGTCGGGCLLELWGRNGAREPRPLRPGDTVTLRVEALGELTNAVVAGREGVPLPPATPGRRRHRAHAQPSSATGS
jgi:2-keto-4-pentenoate hydratase/2-oxohepta-3-ene-1,7-dioic acid hydratase in catechol pathway